MPVLIFTGQVPTPFLGSDAFQEADHIGITRSTTKHNTLVRKTKDLPKAIAEALHISNTGRKGPVLVDMPKDVLLGESEFKIPKKVNLPNYTEEPRVTARVMKNFKDKFLNTPIYSRDRMPFEFEIKGPAIIEQMDTTILIEPNDKVYGDYLGNMFIEVGDFS
mgnify:CR=1 FL=1